MDPRLSNELDRLSDEGRQLDSGKFTIDPQKALKKLGRYALPEPALWVVKMVQAAVAAGSCEICFEFSRNTVKVLFPNSSDWDAAAIFELLLGEGDCIERGLKHLQRGLAGAFADVHLQELQWSCGGQQILFTESEFSTQACLDTGRFELVLTRSRRWSFQSSSPVEHLFRPMANEYKALVDRCISSPIPIYIDSRQLPQNYERPKPHWNSTEAHLLLAIRPLPFPESRPEIPYPIEPRKWDETQLWLGDEKHFSAQYWRSPVAPTRSILRLYLCDDGVSELILTQDGAWIERRNLWEFAEDEALERNLKNRLRNDFTLDIFWEVHDDELDLSQFQVRSETMDRDFLPYLPYLRECFAELYRQSHLPWKFKRIHKPAVAAHACFVATIGLSMPWAFKFFGPLYLAEFIQGVRGENKRKNEIRARLRELEELMSDLVDI